ncbi:3-ketoacyl-CoA thiolase 2, peroxisomal-like [Elaeis guineensis]|uniref:3-ketoacyl-CoA thiolase 2, peroxisomal-like n=1 Tax=Elaeis guineensis var. tenera TaxID=51953 RepID=UPI003C6D1FA7
MIAVGIIIVTSYDSGWTSYDSSWTTAAIDAIAVVVQPMAAVTIAMIAKLLPYLSMTLIFILFSIQYSAYQTPICKSKRKFKDTYPKDPLAAVLKALLDKTKLNPSEVGDIGVGTILAPGSQRANECRMAVFYASFPKTVPVRTINRQCSSGLQAVANVAASIKAGFYDIGIGAGLESMITNSVAWEGSINAKVNTLQRAQDCLLPMGITSENVAHHYGVTQKEQDQAAVESHRRAVAATASGEFKDEIIPITMKNVKCCWFC